MLNFKLLKDFFQKYNNLLNSKYYLFTSISRKNLKLFFYFFNKNLLRVSYIDTLSEIFKKVIRIKWQVKYLFNNWVYSTNHKRISINYFWFVLLAGIVGMVLATIIRIEMAYPGVGILAGDNSQYLSIVTAHGVIMVFFMAMPLLFGFFTNFLLPTQLGVHDVAFPRMNSAAFWFLPASLIVLCQLVCIDRRYQRMNCFNVRELQSLVRKKFFYELSEPTVYNTMLSKSLVGSKYKSTNLNKSNSELNALIGLKSSNGYNNSLIINKTTTISASTTAQFFDYLEKTQNRVTGMVLSSKVINFTLLAIMKPIFSTVDNVTLFKQESITNFNGILNPVKDYVKMEINSLHWYIKYSDKYERLGAPKRAISRFSDQILWNLVSPLNWISQFFRVNKEVNVPLKATKEVMKSYLHRRLPAYWEQFVDGLYIFGNRDDFGYFIRRWKHLSTVNGWDLVRSPIKLWTERYLEITDRVYYLFNFWKSPFTSVKNLIIGHRCDKYTKHLCVWTSIRDLWYKGEVISIESTLVILITPLKKYLTLLQYSELKNEILRSSYLNYYTGFSNLPNNNKFSLSLDNQNFLSNSLSNKLINIESSESNRYLQYYLPATVYKVKIGNYLPEIPTMVNYKHLFNTINQKTISGRKSNWIFSNFVNKELNSPSSLPLTLTETSEKNLFTNSQDKYVPHNLVFYINNLRKLSNEFNLTWLNSITDNQKFINLFLSQTKQTLALNNWKNLKLTREGWRCRMLMARNQNSLYNRFSGEKNLIWVVEKNAKDLLPGWAMITPFSSRTRYTLIGKTDIGVMVVMITLVASLVSCSNFLITYRYLSTLNNRKMRDARSFFVEAIIATCWMTLAANPMLILGLFMLMSDRHWKTSFFDYSGGGDVVLFQHMFWFFGHPEVYIIIVPCFGLVNTMLSFYLRKRISARASLMYSMYTIAFLGFFVWGHHMYMVGLAHTTRMLYSTLTVMISVPAATKIMHWLVTFINSSIHFELPLLFVIAFIFFFLSGGISGMSVAHTGMDVLFHDTFFVIGHFHVMLAGSLMFAGFGACYFYLPAIFGVRYNRFFAYLHFIYYVIGQLFTVVPMMWLGYAGMPRRVLDYPAAMGGWHSLSTSAHILSIAGILCFIIMLFDSLRKKKPYTIKTFGIGRYNTRLNFYIYEINKQYYWQLKTNNVYNSYNRSSRNLTNQDDTTLFFYHFSNKNK